MRTRGAEGPARARNIGILGARYDHVLLLDDDVLPLPGFLGAVEFCLPLKTAEAAMCLVSHFHRQWWEPKAMRYRTTWLGLPDRLLDIGEGSRLSWKLMQSCALLMKREDLQDSQIDIYVQMDDMLNFFGMAQRKPSKVL